MRARTRLLALLGAVMAVAACEGASGFTLTTTGLDETAGSVVGNVTAGGSGLGGVQIIAVGAERDSTVTDGTGSYRLQSLTAGQYAVTVQVPLGFTLAPGQLGTQTTSVPAGGSAVVNFALQESTGSP